VMGGIISAVVAVAVPDSDYNGVNMVRRWWSCYLVLSYSSCMPPLIARCSQMALASYRIFSWAVSQCRATVFGLPPHPPINPYNILALEEGR